ncbi:tetratricopeptide repeat protein [Dokdonia sp.]|uniref:tetratricopeptide repeat protein n=1 Tax=Dokdonia sp. TaxID=2024995 RepID=UPI003266B3FE
MIKAIDHNPNNFYFYRELGFSYRYLGNIEEAETTYTKGIEISDDDFEKSEMAVNMANYYFLIKNRKKFEEWAKLTRKYSTTERGYNHYIDYFEKEWDNESLRKQN